ncbi:ras-related and estrogen-regulated growth inhibitor-like protein [Ischnura elegans]|uniref:ras-related and estrogen-regulated growth inhibitor-like protein n=1 Tax=Ischnura elegans TaxID=197161 RepID=UPI001ED8A9D0|nr:ras-related and estrogen-regulated growth inhibitor-like protein [Ischnura elegans]
MKNTTASQQADLAKVRIAVLGKVNVGKSALTVRYLTRRFIGEYRSKTDLLYRQTMTINNTPLEVEIVDVSGSESEDENDVFPAEEVAWADGCLVVYSITDRDSFAYAEETLRRLRPSPSDDSASSSGSDTESVADSSPSPSPQQPLVLLGNKADLEHLRQVQGTEGKTAASRFSSNAKFYEVSVAENSKDLYEAFETLITECSSRQRNSPPKNGFTTFSSDNNNNNNGNHQNGNSPFQLTQCNNKNNIIQAQQIKVQRKFSVSKMIGNLIGKSVGGNNASNNGGNQQTPQLNSTGVQPVPPVQPQGGTVTVFEKSDLHRSRVLKRRNNCALASASL